MKKIIFLLCVMLTSCSLGVKNNEKRIVSEWDYYHNLFVNLMNKDSLPHITERHLLILEETNKKIQQSDYEYFKKIQPIRDSIDILSPKLDSLMILIEKFPNFIHPWTNKPYQNICDEIFKYYRINSDIIETKNGQPLKWNMEDINNIKNIISNTIQFQPEQTDRYGTLLWTARYYTIELYRTGDHTIHLNIKENE